MVSVSATGAAISEVLLSACDCTSASALASTATVGAAISVVASTEALNSAVVSVPTSSALDSATGTVASVVAISAGAVLAAGALTSEVLSLSGV